MIFPSYSGAKYGLHGKAFCVGRGVVSTIVTVQLPLLDVSATEVAVMCAVPVLLQETRPF